MIRLVDNDQVGHMWPDSDGTEPRLVAETEDKVYQLFSVPRYNKDFEITENYYEIFNTNTGVVESRLKTNFATVMSVMEAMVDVYEEYRNAGSAKAMEALGEAKDAISH